MSGQTDRNLLVGILAVQMDFISRDQLVEAMSAWVVDKARPLEEILLERGNLADDTKVLLVALVAKHLELHEDDAVQSLASVSSIGSLRQELKSVGDGALEQTLTFVSKAKRTPRSLSASVTHLSESFAERLDEICDAFEDAWQHGRPQLREYMERWQCVEGRRELLENLLLIELRQRRHLGELPGRREYEQQFPNDASLIYEAFQVQGATAVDATATFSVGQPTSAGLHPAPSRQGRIGAGVGRQRRRTQSRSRNQGNPVALCRPRR